MKGFSGWWFLNGGDLHRLWKQKRYSLIYEMAKSLPHMAWDESRKQTLEECVKMADAWYATENCPTDKRWITKEIRSLLKDEGK